MRCIVEQGLQEPRLSTEASQIEPLEKPKPNVMSNPRAQRAEKQRLDEISDR